ncbi:cation diffusion facilitator family transporter [Shewanella litorisediminis]|uniref:Cation transporter n=1 Tax=Shewanella litorisediminis TaxID=1173586 RepID=A0ABX7G8B1_9GAMM|nr:cation diffusion facilitator family transporter [Shewanella litorisediminis]MCL2919204.1 cation diffusion facilitator family transporter [Shewanella litorisediminis]QRH03447.1 cation transporter [Shewanella litorisediminis]
MNSKPFHSVTNWQHSHDFFKHNDAGERSTRIVLVLTLVTMVAEILAGTVYGSMALLADGWHMGTHAAAFLITLFAYRYALKHKDDPAFAFGTGKVSVLGGFASAVALGLVALIMVIESAVRLISPHQIAFDEAILVAIIGLSVNLLSAFLLKDHHHHHHHGHHHDDADHEHHGHETYVHHHEDNHEHEHEHVHHDNHRQEHDEHGHDHHHDGHHDHNLRAAYLHVLADALTSVLAIGALLAGKFFGLGWLDPLIGILGAIIIGRWAIGLVKDTGPLLLDADNNEKLRKNVIRLVASVPDHGVSDLHLWRISADHRACILGVVSHQPKSSEYFVKRLKEELGLHHVTVEVHCCDCEVKPPFQG